MKSDVRIVVVGDAGVGKSSLIATLLQDSFEVTVPKVVPEVLIPPSSAAEHVTTRIVDTTDTQMAKLQTEVARADVVCIVWAVDSRESFDRISSYWLPAIISYNKTIPIILIGNKIDTREEPTNPMLVETVRPIMSKYKEVETCVECSARSHKNVIEAFGFAQKAVLYPTSPLYDSHTFELQPKAQQAFLRIFALCDQDRDGVLNEFELHNFLRFSYGEGLNDAEVRTIMGVVAQANSEAISARNNGESLTGAGFLLLHKLFIQHGNLEMPWTCLRAFNYDDTLILSDEALDPAFTVEPGNVVELNKAGMEFFRDLFRSFDTDGDGALNQHEFNALFATAPEPAWEFEQSNVAVTSRGFITLEGWLARWAMTTYFDYHVTMRYLAYLGFSNFSTVGVTARKSMDAITLKSVHSATRTVFNAIVIGEANTGKSTMLTKALGRNAGAYESTTSKKSVAVIVATTPASYLILTEIPATEEAIQTTLSSFVEIRGRTAETLLKHVDGALLMFDPADGAAWDFFTTPINQGGGREVLSLHDYLLSMNVPCLLVATKQDLPGAAGISGAVLEYCYERTVRPPVVSSATPVAELGTTLVSIMRTPELGRASRPIKYWKLAIYAVLIGGGIGAYYYHKKNPEFFKSLPFLNGKAAPAQAAPPVKPQ